MEIKNKTITLFVIIATVQANRKGLPAPLTSKKKLPRGTVSAYRSDEGKGDLLALSWFDKRKVLMVSTKHTNNVIEVSKR